MPYANAADMELGEKMRYFDFQASHSAAVAPGVVAHAATRISGQQYYEDLCMKTVRRLPPAGPTPSAACARSPRHLHTCAPRHPRASLRFAFVCLR
jgi:hypothetical protein